MTPKQRMSKSMWNTLKEKEGKVANSLVKYDNSGAKSSDKITLYHGTNANFDKFGKVGNRITSLGYGHYFTPSMKVAKQYGKNIKAISIDKNSILDLDHLTTPQRNKIVKELKKVVPKNRIAGFGEVKRIDITNMDKKKALKLFEQKKEETKNLWHDRAKASIVKEGNKEYIKWMSDGLDNASNTNIKNLIQRYDQDIPRKLGYKAVRNGDEVVIYDTNMVNNSLVKKTKNTLNRYNYKKDK